MNGNDLDINHSGVLGMKWGHRKAPVTTSTTTTKGSAKKKVNVKDLSDDDLKKIVNRLNMEKQYKTLTGEEVNKGKVAAQKVMKIATTTAAVTGTALTLYANAGKIKTIIDDISKKK